MKATTSEGKLAEALGRNIALKWLGKPAQGLLLRPIDIFLIPFSLMWLGFAIFWETMAMHSGAAIFASIWGVPFVLVGLFFAVGRFAVDAYFRAHTVYGVDDGNAYIVRDGLLPRVVTFNLLSIAPIEMKRRRDGTGTLTFGQQLSYPYGWAAWNVGSTRTFECIPDVVEVYRLVTHHGAVARSAP